MQNMQNIQNMQRPASGTNGWQASPPLRRRPTPRPRHLPHRCCACKRARRHEEVKIMMALSFSHKTLPCHNLVPSQHQHPPLSPQAPIFPAVHQQTYDKLVNCPTRLFRSGYVIYFIIFEKQNYICDKIHENLMHILLFAILDKFLQLVVYF